MRSKRVLRWSLSYARRVESWWWAGSAQTSHAGGEHHAFGDVLDMLQLSFYDATTNIWHHDACLCRAVERSLYRAEGERAVQGLVMPGRTAHVQSRPKFWPVSPATLVLPTCGGVSP